MAIDLNDPLDFTVDNVRKLIASGDDRFHSQVRVSKTGIATLNKSVGNDGTEDDWALSMEIFSAQSDQVGEQASRDDVWVERVYKALRKNWPNPASKYIGDF